LNGLGKWRWIVPGALVVTLALSGSTLAAPTGQITEFPTVTAAANPEGIVAGPDGNLWYAELNANKIAEVNPATGASTEFTPPTAGGGPLGVALGPDGNIWFTEFFGGKIGEINPVTHAISDFAIPTASSGPVAIVTGPNGNLWFTEGAANKIAEINPTTHAFTEFPVPTATSGPFGIAAGPDGNIWFTEKTASKIGVLNLATATISDFATPTPSATPNAIATGPDGTLWFTEPANAASRVGLIDPSSHAITEFPTPVAMDDPVVIAPGPDGNMWFTEGAGKIAVINAVTKAITDFPTTTASSGPVGISPGADGNMWFTEGTASKVGSIGTGAPAALLDAPATSAAAQPGNVVPCQNAVWSSWAGLQPSASLFGFDGTLWLRDGSPIAAGASYTVTSSDVGHHLACEQVVTYPLLQTTTRTSSASFAVSPPLGASLTSTSTTPTTISLTIACQGLPTQTCSGKATLTSHVTTQGSKLVAVAAKTKPKPKPKPPKKVTKVETIASGSYSVAAGRTGTVKLSLNSTGKKLLTARYKVPATLTVTGTASAKKTVTFKYGVISISPAYTWAFSKTFSYAIELSLSRLPKGSKVTLSCHGHGCPFSKKTFSTPKSGKLALASALKKRHLTPGSTVQIQITASNEVGEVVVFTILPGKSPRESFLCLPPGAHRPSACAH
jgi:streptogramin lyase